jgi:hypothetical protein
MRFIRITGIFGCFLASYGAVCVVTRPFAQQPNRPHSLFSPQKMAIGLLKTA